MPSRIIAAQTTTSSRCAANHFAARKRRTTRNGEVRTSSTVPARLPAVGASPWPEWTVSSRPPTFTGGVAWGTEGHRPAWLRVTPGERRWGVTVFVALTIIAQLVLPSEYGIHPRWLGPAVEAAVLVVLVIAHPSRMSQRSMVLRIASHGMIGLVAATNTFALVSLIHDVVTGHDVTPGTLLIGGSIIWLTNVVVFALLYWEYDRGGPASRGNALRTQPDLLFPQMTDERLAADWEPQFLDYLFVSYTNSSAFSPTDTMPLSRFMKALFTVQSLISLLTVAMVLARAVNILPT